MSKNIGSNQGCQGLRYKETDVWHGHTLLKKGQG